MAARVKLLNAAGSGVTGDWFYVGQAKRPFTIYFQDYTAGTVSIQSSPDAFNGAVLNTGTVHVAPEFGEVGGGGETVPLTAIAAPGAGNATVATIRHPMKAIRAVSSGGIGGTATVWFVMDH
jgi:hypothetical protein